MSKGRRERVLIGFFAVLIIASTWKVVGRIERLNSENQSLQQENEGLRTREKEALRMKEYFNSYGKLEELVQVDEIQGLPIVSTKEGTLPIGMQHDKVEAMGEVPVYLTFPFSNKVRLKFKMDLSPLYEAWDVNVVLPNGEKTELDFSSTDKQYYLNLEERGNYFFEVIPKDSENYQYFTIAW